MNLEINGKFKENFTIWLNKASLNYYISYSRFEGFGWSVKIDFMMKFLHGKSYESNYTYKDHDIHYVDRMNELIQEYNNNKTP